MMAVELPYGEGTLCMRCPSSIEVVSPLQSTHRDVHTQTRRALSHPIGSQPLFEVVRRGDSVAVLVPDATRSCPTRIMLSSVMEELERAGAGCITCVACLGIHRKMTHDEVVAAVGDMECIQHDPDRCTRVGITSRGTPVELFDEVLEHDRVIALGRIDYHYYAGYTGGYKALLPGIASRTSIVSNHSMMLESGAQAGRLDGPVRADIDELSRIRPLDFLVNVVGDAGSVVAGHGILAHREGCRLLDSTARMRLPKADILVVSAGGHPKDINLFQAHKAMEHARGALREGGVMILVARCPEGLGNAVFESWARRGYTPEEAIRAFWEVGFEMGAHKLARLAMLARTFKLYLVSGLSEKMAMSCFFTPFATLDEALESARAAVHKKDPKVLVVRSASVLLDGV